jgi:dTDP-4-dehydrorhamnose 3,5-epimerase
VFENPILTDVYARDCERAIRWDDPAIGIVWPMPVNAATPRLAAKDAAAPLLAAVAASEVFA